MNPPTNAPTALPIASGFPMLDYWLRGGYPYAAITTLDGYPHAAKSLTTALHQISIQRGLRVGYLNGMDFHQSPLHPLQLWSHATSLLFQQIDLLILDSLSPLQCRAMPNIVPGLVARRQRTLLASFSHPHPLPATLRLRLTPHGWLYREGTVAAYRLHITATRPAFLQSGITLEIPIHSTNEIIPRFANQ